MLRKLQDQYVHEDADLAPYATHNLNSAGRRFAEQPHPFRTDFQRDRDRILHSRSFRRLEYKTQVFLNASGDHQRTRLTHTIEVSAITRTIARALHLNEDLAETIALAHDLGHTPFGHAGESALNELMAHHGGFDHNDQALVVVDELEQKYPDYDGLNLTWEVRSGLVKHRSARNQGKLDNAKLPPFPHLESQVADLADDLTYYGHDVDDGLEAELIDEHMLAKNEIWQKACHKARQRGMDLVDGSEKSRGYTVRCLIDMMVENAILNSNRMIDESGISSADAAQSLPGGLVAFDKNFSDMTMQLRDFLFSNIYHHPEISRVNDNAVQRMRELFDFFIGNPEALSRTTQLRAEKVGLHRATADFIAGMTDRFALLEHSRHCIGKQH
ncbi:MAG: deoxyguanosinetriphosphate triphosphohydrolase [Victivallales bacterium]|nr:deoxyguanosinetriphosphate triphosphohydrolase [Victivallales bacterium]